MKTNVKQTSRESHRVNIAGMLYRPAETEIIHALKAAPTPLTRSELEKITGLRINQIAGRVNDLIARNLVKIVGRKTCPITGRDVEGVMLV
jgi:predicted HTH transcriptional regulator